LDIGRNGEEGTEAGTGTGTGTTVVANGMHVGDERFGGGFDLIGREAAGPVGGLVVRCPLSARDRVGVGYGNGGVSIGVCT
jgi:hypothetical protein